LRKIICSVERKTRTASPFHHTSDNDFETTWCFITAIFTNALAFAFVATTFHTSRNLARILQHLSVPQLHGSAGHQKLPPLLTLLALLTLLGEETLDTLDSLVLLREDSLEAEDEFMVLDVLDALMLLGEDSLEPLEVLETLETLVLLIEDALDALMLLGEDALEWLSQLALEALETLDALMLLGEETLDALE